MCLERCSSLMETNTPEVSGHSYMTSLNIIHFLHVLVHVFYDVVTKSLTHLPLGFDALYVIISRYINKPLVDYSRPLFFNQCVAAPVKSKKNCEIDL